jgi:hypothetical protein
VAPGRKHPGPRAASKKAGRVAQEVSKRDRAGPSRQDQTFGREPSALLRRPVACRPGQHCRRLEFHFD